MRPAGAAGLTQAATDCPSALPLCISMHAVCMRLPQAALDEWMAEWEVEDAARRAAALKANEEEGWTVVQRHKVSICA